MSLQDGYIMGYLKAKKDLCSLKGVLEKRVLVACQMWAVDFNDYNCILDWDLEKDFIIVSHGLKKIKESSSGWTNTTKVPLLVLSNYEKAVKIRKESK